MKKSIELLEDQVEELYDMVYMLMEYVDFYDDYIKITPDTFKAPKPPKIKLTSRR